MLVRVVMAMQVNNISYDNPHKCGLINEKELIMKTRMTRIVSIMLALTMILTVAVPVKTAEANDTITLTGGVATTNINYKKTKLTDSSEATITAAGDHFMISIRTYLSCFYQNLPESNVLARATEAKDFTYATTKNVTFESWKYVGYSYFVTATLAAQAGGTTTSFTYDFNPN